MVAEAVSHEAVKVCHFDSSLDRTVHSRFSQGSILGPLLYLRIDTLHISSRFAGV